MSHLDIQSFIQLALQIDQHEDVQNALHSILVGLQQCQEKQTQLQEELSRKKQETMQEIDDIIQIVQNNIELVEEVLQKIQKIQKNSEEKKTSEMFYYVK